MDPYLIFKARVLSSSRPYRSWTRGFITCYCLSMAPSCWAVLTRMIRVLNSGLWIQHNGSLEAINGRCIYMSYFKSQMSHFWLRRSIRISRCFYWWGRNKNWQIRMIQGLRLFRWGTDLRSILKRWGWNTSFASRLFPISFEVRWLKLMRRRSREERISLTSQMWEGL